MDILTVGLISFIIVMLVLGSLVSSKNKSNKKGEIKDDRNLPYKAAFSILTKSEKQFFHQLHQSIDTSRYNISCKVRLLDLLFLPNMPNRQSYLQRVWSKHVDFVISDIQTMRPILVVELDDSSHNRQDRKERDAFVDNVFFQAGLPVIHIQTSPDYSNVLKEINNHF